MIGGVRPAWQPPILCRARLQPCQKACRKNPALAAGLLATDEQATSARILILAREMEPLRHLPAAAIAIAACSLRIIAAKPGNASECGPSDRARSGHGSTSTMTPSAPMATAARAAAGTRLRRPVACEGSTTTG